MSYILDALRKSDQQRRRGTAPTLQPAQAAATRELRQPAFLVYAAAGAALLGTGLAIGWLRPWQPGPPVPAAGRVTAQPLESGPRRNATAAPLPTEAVLTREAEAPARVRAAPRGPRRASRSPRPGAAKNTITAATAPSIDPARPSGTPPEQGVLTLSELPPAIQQEIPPMSISVHAYSPRPADRIVGINNRLLREGAALSPGLTLERITPEGMVFSYKGYRFKRAL